MRPRLQDWLAGQSPLRLRCTPLPIADMHYGHQRDQYGLFRSRTVVRRLLRDNIVAQTSGNSGLPGEDASQEVLGG